ncbi:EAL domain-containing protein [Amycolatopsis sp. cmx-4-61]|uniref:EAL domain-containing protein n=1 Tax=Amycolatopsis sp. cmx-4-61 TaxID=2790937 RepID=UPI00397829E2
MTPSAPQPAGPRRSPAARDRGDRNAAGTVEAELDVQLTRIATWPVPADAHISDPQVAAAVDAAAAAAADAVLSGLDLTADDAMEFGRRWYRALAASSYLQFPRKSAEQLFGRWTAALLAALGAPIPDPDRRLGAEPALPTPAQVGYELAYAHKLTADSLGTCVSLLSDLATEYTPRAPRAVKARMVGDFGSGFAEGLQERIRDEQTALTAAFLHLSPAAALDDGLRARRFRAAGADTVTAVLALDPHGRIVEANSTAQTLLDRTLAQLRGRTLPQLASCAEDAEQIRRAVQTLRRTGPDLSEAAQVHTEFRIRTDAYPSARWVTAILGHVGGGQRGFNVLLEDVTFRRGLEHGIDIEPTTGLLTEAAFTAQTRRILADTPERAALLTIRLSGLTHLDHVLPQDLRARLLGQLHARIRGAHDPARHRQLTGRSGDDVLVLLYDLTDWSTVIHLVKQLSDWLRDPVHIDAHQIQLRPRIGIAEARPADTLDDLLRRTRRALHDSADVRAPWIHADPHTPSSGEDDHHRVELLAELTSALDTGSLQLNYHPIRTPAGALAAVRPHPYWISPTGARHDLDTITDLADHTGLLAAALPHILTTAAQHAARWPVGPAPGPAILLGLPGSTVHDDVLLDTLTARAADSGLAPGRLQLAIPAHALTGEPTVLRRLRELPAGHNGIHLALTDVLDDHVPIQAFTTVPWTTISLNAATVTALTSTPAGATPLVAALATIHAFGASTLTDDTPQHTRGFDLYQETTAVSAAGIHTRIGERDTP